jgi:hypothetical protein
LGGGGATHRLGGDGEGLGTGETGGDNVDGAPGGVVHEQRHVHGLQQEVQPVLLGGDAAQGHLELAPLLVVHEDEHDEVLDDHGGEEAHDDVPVSGVSTEE